MRVRAHGFPNLDLRDALIKWLEDTTLFSSFELLTKNTDFMFIPFLDNSHQNQNYFLITEKTDLKHLKQDKTT